MRKRICLAFSVALLVCLIMGQGGSAYGALTKQIVKYRIEATLNPGSKQLTGKERLIWLNDSTVPVDELQFHLYLNAFKNTRSTFMRERGGPNDESFGNRWGWIDTTSIKLADGTDLTAQREFIHPDDDNADDETVFRIKLPRPVQPKGEITLEIEFIEQLPHVLARTGYHDNFFLVAQWFPKIGVFEDKEFRGRTSPGWNCHQFHANTEFYADYGTYDVSVTVPANYIVGATGVLKSNDQSRANTDGTRTYNYYQEDVHDFAWTADPAYKVFERDFKAPDHISAAEIEHWSNELSLPGAEIKLSDVHVRLLLQPEHVGQAERHFQAVFNAIKCYGLWYGKYPYSTLTIVDPPYGGWQASGMEYPTFIVTGTEWWQPLFVQEPETVTTHEFGHQFWYGLVGNNEFEEAWLDEGLNSYSTGKALEQLSPDNPFLRLNWIPLPAATWLTLGLPNSISDYAVPISDFEKTPISQWNGHSRPDYLSQPRADIMERPGWRYMDHRSYNINSYDKPDLMLRTLENMIGAETMARIMREFQTRFRFRHPSARDFTDTANEVYGRDHPGQDLNWYFDQLIYGNGVIDYAIDRITSTPTINSGVYNKDGRRITVDQTNDRLYESHVVVRRLGEVKLPVEIEVRFGDGSAVREYWDGQDTWREYTYTRPAGLVSATVDPDHKIWLDINFTNNSRTFARQTAAVERWSSKWLFWMQNLLQSMSALG